MAKIKIKSKKKAIRKSPSIAEQINEHHKLGHLSAANAKQHAVSCGELLIEQKAKLEHGQFKDWVKAHCVFSYASAALYMKAARSKIQGLDFSTLSELYGTPPSSLLVEITEDEVVDGESLPEPKVMSVSVVVEPQPEQKPQTLHVVMGKPTDDSVVRRPPTVFQRKVMKLSQQVQQKLLAAPISERNAADVRFLDQPEFEDAVERLKKQKHPKLSALMKKVRQCEREHRRLQDRAYAALDKLTDSQEVVVQLAVFELKKANAKAAP